MVRLDRTFSDYSFTGARSAKCTSSMRFKHIEPPRTFSNYILTERGRYLAFFYMSSALFDWTEPSLTASLQGIEGMQGAKCTSWMRFKHIEPHRTFSNCSLTEIARYIDFFHSSSGWFDCTEPSPTTSLQGIQRCAGCTMHRFGEVQAHRTSSNLLDLHPHRDSKVSRLLSHEFGVVRLDRTFSDCIFTGDRSEGAICTSWMRFKHIEPHRTFSNYILKQFIVHVCLCKTFEQLFCAVCMVYGSRGAKKQWYKDALQTSLTGKAGDNAIHR